MTVRTILSAFVESRPFVDGHAKLLATQILHPPMKDEFKTADEVHLLKAAGWLKAAQDAMTDGGVGGRYLLSEGWTSSYPETTGYIIPTFLRLAKELKDDDYLDRAARAVRFLRRVQLNDGGFPGMEVADGQKIPSPFNTAQIIHGLLAWHEASGDENALNAAKKASEWLISVQDDDGAWRRYCYNGVATTYSAHLSCWVAEFGVYVGDARLTSCAERHLDWVLSQVDPETGWVDLCGFDSEQHRERIAPTHTIAYCLWGILTSSKTLQRTDGIDTVRCAAEAILRRLELSGWLPGILDHKWRARSIFTCLTGNAQMSLIWLWLFDRDGDVRFLNAALKALDLVKRAQILSNVNPGLMGGIPGSDPIWGDYIRLGVPSWAAKFFVDALIEKRRVMEGLSDRKRGYWKLPADAPHDVPATASRIVGDSPRCVLYASPRTQKVAQILETWSGFGFTPIAIVIGHEEASPIWSRAMAWLRRRGVFVGPTKFDDLPADPVSDGRLPHSGNTLQLGPEAYCKKAGLRVIHTGPLDGDSAVEAVKELRPDLAIHAGAGILRDNLLRVPRLGTINAHMGLLPYYRGMNVAEWACFQGDQVGCTVHLIDAGIDTGGTLCVREVCTDGVTSIAALRKRVDAAQIALLGKIVRYVMETGTLPSTWPNRAADGVQFFRMHKELTEILEGELTISGGGGSPEPREKAC